MSDSDAVLSRIEKDIKDFGVEKNEEPGLHRDRLMEDMVILQGICKQVPVGIALFDTDLRYAQVNEFAAAITGHSPEQLIGRCLGDNFAGYFGEEVSAEMVARFRHTLETGEVHKVSGWPYSLKHKPDVSFYIDWEVRRLNSPDGVPIGVLLTLADVTGYIVDKRALQNMEAQLRKSRDRLEEIVEERTVDLQAAREEMVAANEELMAVNEELRATGEELIAANQELVAANEELAAVNEQLRLEIVLRKKAEEEIKKSHQELYSILESITDAFFAVDQSWRFIYVNSEAERLWGIKRGELIGRELWELFPEAVDTLFQREYQRAMSHRVAVHFEGFSPVLKRWIDVHAYPFREGLSIYFRDISDRRRAEEKLRLNESRLEALARLNKMTGATTKELIDFVVEEVVRLTGSDIGFVGTLNRDESVFTSRSRYDKAVNECEIEDKPLFYTLNSSGLWAEVVRRRRPFILNDYTVPHHAKKGFPEGHPPLCRIMIIPVFDRDRIVMLAGVANKKENYDDLDVLQLTLLMSGLWEILQRKKAEEELRLSNERFARSFNASPVMMTINSHADLRFIDANEAFLKGVEYTRPEVIGRTLEELNILADSEGQAEEIKRTIAEQGTLYNRELRFRTKNGDVRVGLASVDTFFINNEQCVLWVMQDITEKRQIEKEIARLERFNLVGQMAAGIGHEIRNPMTAVRGFLQLLGGRKEYADYRQYFDLMIDELDRANSIITEYLSLARNKSVDLVEIRLDSILRVLYPLIMADALNAGVNVEFKLEDVPEFPLNENEIRQLILNLVRNGIEAMPAGGILSIHTYSEGEEVILSVRDQGGGIDEDALEKLGTPFFTTKDNGTGLGLAVCYSVAARHKAIIDVETSPGGTAFRVRFRVKRNGDMSQGTVL